MCHTFPKLHLYAAMTSCLWALLLEVTRSKMASLSLPERHKATYSTKMSWTVKSIKKEKESTHRCLSWHCKESQRQRWDRSREHLELCLGTPAEEIVPQRLGISQSKRCSMFKHRAKLSFLVLQIFIHFKVKVVTYMFVIIPNNGDNLQSWLVVINLYLPCDWWK